MKKAIYIAWVSSEWNDSHFRNFATVDEGLAFSRTLTNRIVGIVMYQEYHRIIEFDLSNVGVLRFRNVPRRIDVDIFEDLYDYLILKYPHLRINPGV